MGTSAMEECIGDGVSGNAGSLSGNACFCVVEEKKALVPSDGENR